MNINFDAIISHARVIANNDEYGYSQPRRNKGKERDCSSGSLDCLNAGGFNFDVNLCTDTMLAPLLAAGFIDVTKSVNLITGKGLKKCDVCLRPKTKERGGHVVIILEDDGKEIFQNAGDFDGKPGDSSGKEICIKPFYPSPFKYALRYPQTTTVTLPTASALSTACPYTEPTTTYTPRNTFRGNDARWFEWQLLRIGHTPESLGCTKNLDAHGTDGVAAVKVWTCIHFQQRCAGLPVGDADERTRDYLKSVPTR